MAIDPDEVFYMPQLVRPIKGVSRVPDARREASKDEIEGTVVEGLTVSPSPSLRR